MLVRKCRECKETKSIEDYSLDRGVPRRLCKSCASKEQSKRYRGQGAEGRTRVLNNWNAHFLRDPTKARFTLSKSAAKQSGHVWELSLEQFRFLNSKVCDYCEGKLPEKGRGLDRLDNSKGYTEDNVVPCCTVCNTLRGNHFTPEETRVAAQALKQYRVLNGGV
jgi:hypothetical protein